MKKIVSFLLSVVLLLSLVPVLPVTEAEAASSQDHGVVTIRKEQSTIAPGITQEIGTVRKNCNKEQMVYYTMKVDLDNPNAHIYANYKDNNWQSAQEKHYGLQTVKEQMDAAQERHKDEPNYTVVGGVNGTGYTMATGQTRGILVMEGNIIQEDAVNAWGVSEPFFAIDKQGKPHIYWNENGEDWKRETKNNNIQEAINAFPLRENGTSVLVKDGVNVAKDDGAIGARTALGINKYTNEVVLLVVDGEQAPYSEGCDLFEFADIFIAAGCTDAINLDGGGSTTFVSRPEGEETYSVVSRPCDGAPRAVGASLLVVSTAPDDKKFDRASIRADADYITPGGTIELTAKGVTAAGSAVEIPEDVEWSYTGDAGKLVGNGASATFTANDTITQNDTPVEIKLQRGNEDVGEITVHVVKPNVLKFTQQKYMVPYGKSMPFEVTAAYAEEKSEHPVTLHGDVTFSLNENGLGKIQDNVFTAHTLDADGAVDTGTVTATLNCNSETATASIELGRGSEMVFDFEDEAQLKDWNPKITSTARDAFVTIEYASKEDGHVHSGEHSMRITFDYDALSVNSATGTSSACNMNLIYNGTNIELKGATGFGAWIWVPDEEKTFTINPMFGLTNSYKEHELDTNSYQREGVNFDEGHWEWVCFDANEFNKTNEQFPFTIEKTDRIGFYIFCANTAPLYDNLSNNYVFYLDDFMVDYSPVTPDREAPTIKNVKTHLGADIYDTLERGSVYEFASNIVSFNAEAADDEGFNSTGINPDSAHAYIDGYEVNARFTNGQIVVDPFTVADGVHTLKLYISDNEENTTNQTRQFKVDTNSGIPTIKVVPQKNGDDRVLMGGVTYVDVIATDISKIQKVDLTMDLINNAQWEIKHTDVNPKFEMSEPVIDKYENIATVTFTRRTDWREGDSETIASIPVRAWTYDYDTNSDRKETNANMWKYNISPHNIELDVDTGVITYVDGYATEAIPAFGTEHLRIETELFAELTQVHAAYPDKETWHSHDKVLESVQDKEATCTERGLHGKKICKVCGSPVSDDDWGTVLDVIPHVYEDIDGIRQCTVCHLPFTGEHENKTYVDGVCLKDWQEDNTYYVDGVKLGEGLHKVREEDGSERWHNFDENGVCKDKDIAYTGYYTGTDGYYTAVDKLPDAETLKNTAYYYVEGGLPYDGWLFFRQDGTQVENTETQPPVEGEDGETDPDVNPEDPNGGKHDEDQQRVGDIVGYHVHDDGRVYCSTQHDTRKCVESGYIQYTCDGCSTTKNSQWLWWIGHDWDANHKCKTCNYQGQNIADASLNIMGKRFNYTGQPIRAAVYVYHDSKSLSVRSDKNGLDGYVWYENNVEIGEATVHIRGEGNYYGEISGTFEIVPQSVKKVEKTESNGSADKVTVTLNWDECLGADYYDVYRYDYDEGQWIIKRVDAPATTFSEELALGTKYDYRVASRAQRGEKIYYSALWPEAVYGTIDHVWGEETNRVEPKCEDEGSYEHTCTLCGFTETVTVPATGHKVETWEITEQATTSAPGERKGTCTVCGETVTEEIPQLPPVITGTGNTTSPDAKQETVTNEDGSTTTTTTNSDGSVTETTTQTDGTVTEKNTEKSGVVTETTTKPDNTVTEKVTQTDGSATEKTTTPDGVVGQKSTDAEGKVTSAEVVIPKEAEKQDVVTVPVEVPASKTAEDAPEIQVKVGFGESAKVEIPVTEFGPGTVAVVVHEDGTEEVVRDCVIGENGVVLNVEGDVTLKIVDNTETFEDVEPANHWASNAVEFVAARELFNGTGENKFTPNGAMTRGMMVTVLYRLAYEPDTVAEQFADVPSGQYYSDAVAWAQNAGVVTGYDDNTFAPDDNVKREQLVTILYRYAKKMGYTTTASGTLAGYADASSVSGWAKDAMSWAIDIGLVNGVDATHLAPANNATRAEVATILMRFCEKVVK